MKVILFGASGLVGKSVLRQCLLDPDVKAVLSVGRRPSAISHPKLRDIVCADMFAFNVNADEWNGYVACFFCLGVSSVGMSEAEYTRLTYNLTMGWAHALARLNPALKFLYVSGMGAGGKAQFQIADTRATARLAAPGVEDMRACILAMSARRSSLTRTRPIDGLM